MNKLEHCTRVLWGLFAVFALVGAVMGHSLAGAYVAMVLTTMWALFRIIHEGFASLKVMLEPPREDEDDSQDK